MGTEDEVEISLVKADVVEEFANWLPMTGGNLEAC